MTRPKPPLSNTIAFVIGFALMLFLVVNAEWVVAELLVWLPISATPETLPVYWGIGVAFLCVLLANSALLLVVRVALVFRKKWSGDSIAGGYVAGGFFCLFAYSFAAQAMMDLQTYAISLGVASFLFTTLFLYLVVKRLNWLERK